MFCSYLNASDSLIQSSLGSVVTERRHKCNKVKYLKIYVVYLWPVVDLIRSKNM